MMYPRKTHATILLIGRRKSTRPTKKSNTEVWSSAQIVSTVGSIPKRPNPEKRQARAPVRRCGSPLWPGRSAHRCQSIAQMAQMMFKLRLRNHRILARTASGLGLNGMESGDGGRPKGVPVLREITMSCFDTWLSKAMVCSPGSGDEFL